MKTTTSTLAILLLALASAPAAADDKIQTRVYNVRDLALAAPKVDLAASARKAVKWPKGASLTSRNGMLVIRQTAPGHAAIAKLLSDLRRKHGQMVSIEVRLVTLPGWRLRGWLRRLERRPTRTDGGHLVGRADHKFLARFLKGRRVEVLSSPRVTCFDRQRSEVAITEQTPYVKAFEKANPVIGTLQTGLVLKLRPVISKDRKHITVEIESLHARLVRMTKKRTKHGTISVPEIDTRVVKLTASARDGDTLGVFGIPVATRAKLSRCPVLRLLQRLCPHARSRRMVMLITARRIALEEPAPKKKR